MAYANAYGAMAIATGNKSELAQGYCTPMEIWREVMHHCDPTNGGICSCENFQCKTRKASCYSVDINQTSECRISTESD